MTKLEQARANLEKRRANLAGFDAEIERHREVEAKIDRATKRLDDRAGDVDFSVADLAERDRLLEERFALGLKLQPLQRARDLAARALAANEREIETLEREAHRPQADADTEAAREAMRQAIKLAVKAWHSRKRAGYWSSGERNRLFDETFFHANGVNSDFSPR